MPRLPAALLLLLLPGCVIITDDDGDDSPPEITLDENCTGNPVYVEAAYIDRDYLVVDASYGGCDEANVVRACWDGRLLESLPGQVVIQVRQSGSGECDALQRSTMTFDLSPVLDVAGRGDELVVNVGEQRPSWNPWAY